MQHRCGLSRSAARVMQLRKTYQNCFCDAFTVSRGQLVTITNYDNMASLGIAQFDMTELPTSLLETRSTGRLRRVKSSPTISQSDGVLKIGSPLQGSMTGDIYSTDLGGLEAQRPQVIPYLGPVPDGFYHAYDYLGKVKSFAEDIEPGLFDILFDQCPKKSDGTVYTILKENIGRIASPSQRGARVWYSQQLKWDFDRIRQLRCDIGGATETHPCVLIVEAIDILAIQALGMAFNVNPSLFATHLQRGRVTTSTLEALSDKFASFPFPYHLSSLRNSTGERIPSTDVATVDFELFDHTNSDDKRSTARISCWQASKKFCKYLLTLVIALSDLPPLDSY